MNDNATELEDDKEMTVESLINDLKKYPLDTLVVVLCKMPYDKDDEENKGKTEAELEEEQTIEVPLSGIDEMDYEDGSRAIGLFVDLHEASQESDDDDEPVDGNED